MSETDIEILKAYINAIDTFGTIDYKCINNLYKPIKNVLKELDKKDKVIELMAKVLRDEYCTYEPCPMEYKVNCDNQESCVNCIKQYFYKKVEEEK